MPDDTRTRAELLKIIQQQADLNQQQADRIQELEAEMESVRSALQTLGCGLSREQLSRCCVNGETLLQSVSWALNREHQLLQSVHSACCAASLV